MGGWLKQSTAYHIMFGPFLDKTDGVTLEVAAGIITSIDHGTTGIFLSKNGAAGAIRHAAVTASVLDAYGMFQVHLDGTDTNTVGHLRVMMAEAATFLPVWDDYMILPANVYDALMGTDLLDVNMAQILGTAVSAPATAGILDINLKNIANVAVSTTTAQLGTNVVQISGDATAADNCEADYDGTGYLGGTIVKQSDATKILGAAINTANAQVGVNVVSQANIDFGALQKASLNAATPASVQGAVGSVTGGVTVTTNNDKTGYTAAVSDKTGFSLSTAGILAIWHQLLVDIVTSLTIGKKLKDWVLGTDSKAIISTDAQDLSGSLDVNMKTKTSTLGLTTQEKLDVNAEADTALSDYDPPTRTELTTDKDSIITEVNANETKLDIIAGYIDTEIGDIKAVTDKVGGLIEDVTGNRFTTKALEQAPSGGAVVLATSQPNYAPAKAGDSMVASNMVDISGLALEASMQGVITETQSQRFADGIVYIDSVNGTNGTDYPYGTAKSPTTTIGNAKTIADANNLRVIRPLGFLVIAEDTTSYVVSGDGFEQSQVQLSVGADYGTFHNIRLQGACEGFVEVFDSYLYNFNGINGNFVNCGFGGTVGKINDTSSTMTATIVNGYSSPYSGELVAFDVSGKTTLKATNWTGDLKLKNGGANTVVAMYLNSATITIDSTCTAGSYTFYGSGNIINNGGAGITLVDNTINTIMAKNSTVAKEATLTNVTYGLSALQVLLDAIATSTELTAMFDAIKGVGWTNETLKAIKESGVTIDAQQIRDAMKLTPTAGDPAAGSVDKHLDDMPQNIWEYTTRTLTSFGTLITSIWTYATRKLTSALTDEAIPKDMARITEIGDIPTVEEINDKLSEEHGTGSWVAGTPYVIRVDANATEYNLDQEKVKIYTNTTPTLEFIVSNPDGSEVNLLTKTVYFIVKKDNKTPLAKAIINKLCTVTAADRVTVALTLPETTALTNKEGEYKGQLDIGPDENVSVKFDVVIERKLRQ